MTRMQHGALIVVLMALAGGLLGWKASKTEILFADGLRYVRQAQTIEGGELAVGLLKAVDHPIYPLGIVAAHRVLGGEGPLAWQGAAQLASILAGILLVIPLYLLTVELFGGRVGWLACALAFIVPVLLAVSADTLSESTFLLFWTWGVWTALRFLREGAFFWLPATIALAALAYLTRPEGLLLPAALVGALALMPLLPATRMNWPRWWRAVAFLVLGPSILIGPYVVSKGGLGTKPAIARFLGTAPKSAPDAVERSRLLEPGQSIVETYAHAAKATFEAVRDAVTVPLLILAGVGLVARRPYGPRARPWLFLGIILVASVLALIRLHATGGYCSPRHALVPAILLIPTAAFGLDRLLNAIAIPGRYLGMGEGKIRPGPAFWGLSLAALLFFNAPKTFAPLNESFGGYREAGEWLAESGVVGPGESVVDVTGWAIFYSQIQGYTFADLILAHGDPKARWVVTREAHLYGPWDYCERIRQLVGGRMPSAIFPEEPDQGEARIYVFDRQAEEQFAILPLPDAYLTR